MIDDVVTVTFFFKRESHRRNLEGNDPLWEHISPNSRFKIFKIKVLTQKERRISELKTSLIPQFVELVEFGAYDPTLIAVHRHAIGT